MGTQDFFNEMMEGAILYLKAKGYIATTFADESPEPDYEAMREGLKEQGLL